MDNKFFFSLLLSVILLAGCVSRPDSDQLVISTPVLQPDPQSQALPEPGVSQPDQPAWRILLHGLREDEVTSSFYTDAKQHTSHYRTIEVAKKGVINQYLGMPLYLVIAMVDSREGEHPYTFDQALWEAGYEITFTAADGYSATFSTADYPSQAFFLADTLNGEPIAPCITGELPGNLQVKNLAEIELGLSPALTEALAADFTLVLRINDKEFPFTITELEQSGLYLEDTGSFTTSAGTTYSNVYGGVPLTRLLGQYLALQPETTVRFVATDDYEMVYKGSDLLDESAGTWILAFKMDGAYLPADPGYIRTIKIGPDNPNIDGHLSVKMIKEMVVEGRAYRDFQLQLSGKMEFTLDRQTFQSGVNCHKKEVFFERKGLQAHYTGIPLWRLLAYADDPRYAPHKQDSAIISYSSEAAASGYQIEISAADGFSIRLDSREVDKNDDLILALYKEGGELAADEWPLVLVWDKDAAVIPAGIKPVKMITAIKLLF